MAILKIKDQEGNIIDIPAIRGDDGYTPQKGVDYFTDEDIAGLNIPSVDQTYTPNSENAQSGKAVAEAVATKADKTEVDKLNDDLANKVPKADYAPEEKTDAMTQPVGKDVTGKLWTASGSGISVTGATVGQTVKISAVDDGGVPTAWEPVDFPSGGTSDELEIIADVVLKKSSSSVVLSEDLNGQPFLLKKVIVEMTATQKNHLFFPAAGDAIKFNNYNKGFFSNNTNTYTHDSYLYCFPSKPDAITTETYIGHLFARWELEINELGVMLGKGRTGVMWEDADGKFYLPNGSSSGWAANTENRFTGRVLEKNGISKVSTSFLYDSLPTGTHIVIKGIRM